MLDAGADLGVVVAFGQLIQRPVLERLPMVNLHFSLLPRWRGAAPVERALLAGDAETGVCLMQLEEGLDTGPVFARRRVPIDARVDRRRPAPAAGRRRARSCSSHDPRRRAARPDAPGGRADLRREARRRPTSSRLGAPADELDRVVRVGGAWTTFRGRRLKVLDAEPVDAADGGEPDETDEAGGPAPGALIGDDVTTGSGRLRLLTVQPEGKPAMAAAAWRHGAHPGPADRLGPDRRGGTVRGHDRRALRNRPGGQGAHRVRRGRARDPRGPQRRGARRAADGGGLLGGRPSGRRGRDRRPSPAALTELADGFAGLIVSTGGTGFTPARPHAGGHEGGHRAGGAGAGRGDAPGQPPRPAVAGHRRDPRPGVILNTPGSPKGCVEQLEAVLDVLPHALRLLAETPTDH